jgi:sugar fermentation stimulation protein A
MDFADPLVTGTLLRREKRFLAYVRLDDGREVIAHTNNSGAMTGCSEPGSVVWLSPADKPNRKLKWTWEVVHAGPSKVPVGVNTLLPNRLVEEAIAASLIPELRGYDRIRREVRYGSEKSRIDLLLESDEARCWVEVKNATLVEDGRAYFPDAVTARGLKHLRELQAQVALGDRAALVFTLQRSDASSVSPADNVDPAYGAELRRAHAAGVEILAWQADVSIERIVLARALPVVL